MTRLLWAGILLLVPLPTWAAGAEHSKHIGLTPQEIADGWIMLFDGETPFGWNNAAKWTVFQGMLAPQTGNTLPLVTSTEFGDCELRLEYRLKPDSGKASVILGCDADGKPSPTGRTVNLEQRFLQNDFWALRVTVAGGLVQSTTMFPANRGARFAPPVPPTKSIGATPPPPIRGHIALVGGGVVLRNIRLKPMGMTSIFNGKDLTGWKEIPGKKSKFRVTREGWLNVKDGPGDLQTEGQWADFVLQLDCKSNGAHLNSGVFFRCLPGQFWSGYEAQIRNQWQGDDRSRAVDYGTGGIYNRQPARRVVSSDREWFTMTVAAQGKHLAVWVNGYQTADFMDNRSPSESARKGCKVDKGPISLQGHDRTTDLDFRNIRIVDTSKAVAPPGSQHELKPGDKIQGIKKD